MLAQMAPILFFLLSRLLAVVLEEAEEAEHKIMEMLVALGVVEVTMVHPTLLEGQEHQVKEMLADLENMTAQTMVAQAVAVVLVLLVLMVLSKIKVVMAAQVSLLIFLAPVLHTLVAGAVAQTQVQQVMLGLVVLVAAVLVVLMEMRPQQGQPTRVVGAEEVVVVSLDLVQAEQVAPVLS
jgi:hypothetical protein